MSGLEGFHDYVGTLIAVVGIGYPLVLIILRESIRSNDNWIKKLSEDYVKNEVSRKSLRESVGGYLYTLEKLLVIQQAFGLASLFLMSYSLILLYSSILVSYGYTFLDTFPVFLLVFFILAFFSLIVGYPFLSAYYQRENHRSRIPERFEVDFLTERNWLFLWEWTHSKTESKSADGCPCLYVKGYGPKGKKIYRERRRIVVRKIPAGKIPIKDFTLQM